MKLHQFVKIRLNEGLYAYGNIGTFLGKTVKITLRFPDPGRVAIYSIDAVTIVNNIDKYLYL